MMADNTQTIQQGKRILCVGMCVLDIIHVCEQYPQEDTDKRCLAGYWQRGGNASNNCTVLRQLGMECEFLGTLSESKAFSFLLEDCRTRGITIEHCPYAAQDPPFSSVILVKSNDSRTIIHSNSNFPILRYEHFRNIDLNLYRWIHFEARNPDETLLMLHSIHAYNATKKLPNERVRVSVEFEKSCVENFVLAPWVDLLFLGKILSQHLGWSDGKEAVYSLRQMIEKNREATMPTTKPAIICTWGAEGASCLTSLDEYTHLSPAPTPVIEDSLGAGDTFCAATIFALLERTSKLSEAVAFGNRCAGYKIGHRGYDAVINMLSK